MEEQSKGKKKGRKSVNQQSESRRGKKSVKEGRNGQGKEDEKEITNLENKFEC